MVCLASVDARRRLLPRPSPRPVPRLLPISEPVPVRARAPVPVMPLQPSDIERIASLARLRLDAAEQAAMLEQINAFFTQVVEPMRAVDTDGVRLREDQPREPALRDAALRNAPASQDGLFIVPRVVE